MTQEFMQYDLLIVGAGPAGLSAGIHYANLCKKANKEVRVCILEKASEVGAHILSGAVFEPQVLNELVPHWQAQGAPVKTQATMDAFLFLTQKKAFSLPVPPQMKNSGNYIISLSELCHWLGKQAEQLGIEIYPGFAAKQVLINENECVIGVQTNDMGLDKDGNRKANFQPGVKIFAKQTLIAEGCRGSLAQMLIKRFALDKKSPQTYGLGIKELWKILPSHHNAGKVIHTIGWPLPQNIYGGCFIYHFGENLLSMGLIVGLDYKNPYLNPFEEFQRFKHHPSILPMLEGGRCMSYGARALNEGGWQSMPKLTFPGGMLLGCSAGFLNVPKIKGSHNAMRSGIIAAETVFEGFCQSNHSTEFFQYEEKIKKSAIGKELYRARNIRPAFRWGLLAGLAYSIIETYLFGQRAPWTFSNHADHLCLKFAKDSKKIIYPKADGTISFDKMTALALSHVQHEENQPCHLHLKDPSLAIKINWKEFGGPEQYYCPAGVYEFIDINNEKKLQINASNCIHCKTCDIKDPFQNIQWVPPEGGGGPHYHNM